ncbi:MAG: hypothetical protein JO250_17770 [Armatimonadetes bacterium]|nr:hypothetical protein [Armatimonadota bacterium]
MALNVGWTNHLLSTRSVLRATIAKIERIAAAGQSPSGSAGTPLTPLPEAEWHRLRQGLDALLAEADALVAALAPEEAARSAQIQPVEATRYHLSLLLRELDQNVLADLEPKRGARYGRLALEDEAHLADALARMRRRVRELQDGQDRKPG